MDFNTLDRIPGTDRNGDGEPIAKVGASATVSAELPTARRGTGVGPARGSQKIGVVFADPHPILLHGMRYLLKPAPDLRILACCMNDEEALAEVRRHQPSLLILELNLPRKGGLAVLRELADLRVRTRPILLTGSISAQDMTQAMRLGVRGIVLKSMPPELLIECLRQVHRGSMWLEKASIGAVVQEMLHRENGLHELRQRLTPRELQVLHLVAIGTGNKDITAKLNISDGTVKIHLHNIYEKLGIRNRLQLALFARDRGLV